jgi:hypothetical protein
MQQFLVEKPEVLRDSDDLVDIEEALGRTRGKLLSNFQSLYKTAHLDNGQCDVLSQSDSSSEVFTQIVRLLNR